MRNVYLAQVNDTYGRNAFLPYSAGCLIACALADPQVADAYRFHPPLYLKEDLEAAAARIVDPDVLGLSCYIWNWQYNLALARRVRERHPKCLVVLGGPQVPDRALGFFEDHPYVDLLVHGEGEVAFSRVLRAHAMGNLYYGVIPGVSQRFPVGFGVLAGPAHPVADASTLPSPYVAGVFDPILEDGWDFHALQETVRGCPYQCSFCQWGADHHRKLRPLSEERVLRELAWCAERHIELLYNCDANVGLLERDVDLARAMVESKRKYGYPMTFRAAFDKTGSARVMEIARMLNQAGLARGLTLSLQSLHPPTLEAICRKNMPLGLFRALVAECRRADIPTYTELILGLPLETYESFRGGVEEVLEAGQHEGVNVYPCLMLPNAPMADPEYRRRYRLVAVRTRLLQHHRTATRPPGVPDEYCDVVVETSTMPAHEWRRAYLLAWAIQALHCLGLTSHLAIKSYQEGVPYVRFYEELLDWAGLRPDTVLGDELRLTARRLRAALAGGPWGDLAPGCGDIVWPFEEMSFLRLAAQADRCYEELAPIYSSEHLAQQRRAAVLPDRFPDMETFAREAVWYGRKNPAQRLLKEA